MDPNGKTALVAGGASGLGDGAVVALLAAGARVVVLDKAASSRDGVLSIACDVTDDAGTEAAIAEVADRLGPIHIGLNCVGIGGLGAIATPDAPGDMAAFRRVIDVNLLGAVNVTRCVAHHMIGNQPGGPDGERGVILNTASIASFEGQEGMGAYAASKAALAALTLVWTRDLARHAIRCVTLAPGFFATPMSAAIPEALQDELLATAEFPRRPGRPDEFADAVLFAIRSTMLNGEVIRLDAGTRPPARTRWSAGG